MPAESAAREMLLPLTGRAAEPGTSREHAGLGEGQHLASKGLGALARHAMRAARAESECTARSERTYDKLPRPMFSRKSWVPV